MLPRFNAAVQMIWTDCSEKICNFSEAVPQVHELRPRVFSVSGCESFRKLNHIISFFFLSKSDNEWFTSGFQRNDLQSFFFFFFESYNCKLFSFLWMAFFFSCVIWFGLTKEWWAELFLRVACGNDGLVFLFPLSLVLFCEGLTRVSTTPLPSQSAPWLFCLDP